MHIRYRNTALGLFGSLFVAGLCSYAWRNDAWAIFQGEIPASKLVTVEFESGSLMRDLRYTAYLPPGYESSGLRYPTLYLLHGNGHNDNSWISEGHIRSTVDALIAKKSIPPLLIVMPNAGTSWYVDRKEKMESAIINDLIVEAEKRFRIIHSRCGRLIGGISMGGYGSMRFALNYPEHFVGAALLSPAIYEPYPPENSGARRVGVFGSPNFDEEVWKRFNYPALMGSFLEKGTKIPMYIVSGDDDEFFAESAAMEFYEVLRKYKQPAELRIVNGGHNWALWQSSVGDALHYLAQFISKPVPPNSDTKCPTAE